MPIHPKLKSFNGIELFNTTHRLYISGYFMIWHPQFYILGSNILQFHGNIKEQCQVNHFVTIKTSLGNSIKAFMIIVTRVKQGKNSKNIVLLENKQGKNKVILNRMMPFHACTCERPFPSMHACPGIIVLIGVCMCGSRCVHGRFGRQNFTIRRVDFYMCIFFNVLGLRISCCKTILFKFKNPHLTIFYVKINF